ncbi:MAG: Hpt domain-containing protein [Chitinivibrionales bacterium]|nr:Hpt domain-containing protein [Chitinivibrionales bacterium]
MESSVLNYTEALERMGGNTQLLNTIIAKFLDIVGKQVEQCREAYNAGDRKSVEKIAHDIKGSARTIGADDFAVFFAALESACQHGDTFVIDRSMQMVQSYVVDAFKAIAHVLQEHS